MSTPLAAGANAGPRSAPPPQSSAERVLLFLVARRVAISFVLFLGLVLIDLLVLRTQPRDVLHLADPLVSTSLVLLLSGLSIRSWAAGTLHKNRQLTTTGPYSLVRNPLYAGSFLMMAAFCLLLNDPQTLWVVIGPVAVIYWAAIRYEERTMARIFPLEWPTYKASVPRLIPRRLLPAGETWSLAQWRKNREYNAWAGSLLALAGLAVWRLWS